MSRQIDSRRPLREEVHEPGEAAEGIAGNELAPDLQNLQGPTDQVRGGM
jgi:hypothetical protein